VRGTRFGVRVYQKDGTWITVVEVMDGIVEVTDKVGKVLQITEGEETEISELGTPDKAEKMDRASRRNLQNGMQPLDSASATGEEEGGTGEVSAGDLTEFVDSVEVQVDQTLEGLETETGEPARIDSDDDNDSELF
jgi:hypothetical protein